MRNLILAAALILASSALSTSAYAHRGHVGASGVPIDHAGGRSGRLIAGADGGYGGRIGGSYDGVHEDTPRDPWGQWGSYYGPMVSPY